jgi:hypothetical protein
VTTDGGGSALSPYDFLSAVVSGIAPTGEAAAWCDDILTYSSLIFAVRTTVNPLNLSSSIRA